MDFTIPGTNRPRTPESARRHAEWMRRTLEEARCDSLISDWSDDDRDLLRGMWGEALIRESIANIQARQVAS